MIATGIENSIPTIQGGMLSIDAFEKSRHYTKPLSRYFFLWLEVVQRMVEIFAGH
jgi:hypothetical protein